MNRIKVSVDDILNHSAPYISASIYSLYKGDLCVYVGQTTDLKARIYSHSRNPSLDFNRVEYYECAYEDADNQEAKEIARLKPTNTVRMPINDHYITLATLKLDIANLIDDNKDKLGIVFESGRSKNKPQYIEVEMADRIITTIREEIEG